MEERRGSQYPNPRMSLVLQHFYDHHPEVVDRAGQTFFSYVQATQERIPKEKIEQLFHEWFVYDFHLKTNKTTIETYVYRNPDNLNDEDLELMRQAGESSYSNHFWISEVNPEKETLLLKECNSDKSFEVLDATASQNVPSNAGLIAARLIKLEGTWYFSSDPIYFLPIPPASSEHGEPFIDIVKLHYGIGGPPGN